MSEESAIRSSAAPQTRTSLTADLRLLGLSEGGVAIVHTSLSAIGWVCGGPVAVIQALLDVLGPSGTLVMPTHSAQLTDPAKWMAPPVPTHWVETIHREIPAYDPRTTPTRHMGAVAELFRTWPNVLRSAHPTCSFAARGPAAGELLDEHQLESPLGECSPLAKLYKLDGIIVLLGVGFDKCTMLHLAEERAWPDRPLEQEGAPIMTDDTRRWVTYQCPPAADSRHFLPIGERLLSSGQTQKGKVGAAECMVVSARQAVDHAVSVWRESNPSQFGG